MLDKDNYFKLFSLEESLDIDLNKLEDKYLELQQKFHPDRIFDKRSNILEISSLINMAYSVLKDDLRRIGYLLKIKTGIDVESEINQPKPSTKILEKVFELKERILETKDEIEILNIKNTIIYNISNLVKKIKKLNLPKNKTEIIENLVYARYLRKILLDISNKL